MKRIPADSADQKALDRALQRLLNFLQGDDQQVAASQTPRNTPSEHRRGSQHTGAVQRPARQIGTAQSRCAKLLNEKKEMVSPTQFKSFVDSFYKKHVPDRRLFKSYRPDRTIEDKLIQPITACLTHDGRRKKITQKHITGILDRFRQEDPTLNRDELIDSFHQELEEFVTNQQHRIRQDQQRRTKETTSKGAQERRRLSQGAQAAVHRARVNQMFKQVKHLPQR